MEDLVGSIDAAVHATVAEYVDPRTNKRGAVALAPRLGMQPGTLSNKANPLQAHTLTLQEAVALMAAADDYRILHATASAVGHVAYPLPDVRVSDIELLDCYAKFHEDVGHKARALRHALADGRITHDEIATVRGALEALIRSGLGVVARLQALV